MGLYARFRSSIVAFAGVGVASLVLGLCISAAMAGSWWRSLDQSKMTLGSYEVAAQRLSGAVRSKERGEVKSETKVGIILGSSTLRDGIDPAALSSETGNEVRWINLHGLGLEMEEMLMFFDLQIRSKLKTDYLMIAADLGGFAHVNSSHADAESVRSLLAIPKHLAQSKPNMVVVELKRALFASLNTLFPDRSKVTSKFRFKLNEMKLRLFLDGSDRDITAIYSPDKDPWTMPAPTYEKPLFSGMKDFKESPLYQLIIDRGWFNLDSYQVNGPNAIAYKQMIALAKANGIKVCLVLIPQSSIFRELTPVEAIDRVRTIIDVEKGPDAPTFVDLRTLIPDEDFFDYLHLTAKGRDTLTRHLAELWKKKELFRN